MHLARGEERALGVVLMCDGRTEEGKDRIAGELFDVALIPVDDVAQCGDDWIDDLEQLLGIEAIGEAGEAG